MSIYIKGMEMPTEGGAPTVIWLCADGTVAYYTGNSSNIGGETKAVPVPPHGRLIDADALTKEINDRIEAAIKWGVNAIADRDDEIKTRAEQAVATFCEASLAAKKLPTIIPADKEGA